MEKKETYWQKNKFCERQIQEPIAVNTKFIVVIPCYNEDAISESLKSLLNCDKPNSNVEVIVVINAPENASEQVLLKNKQSAQEFFRVKDKNGKHWIKLHLIEVNKLPKKHAGVGLARKIGMDEAVLRFDDINEEEGVVICFDADSTCAKNYLVAIENHFNKNKKTPGCSIKFEHPLYGDEYTKEIYNAILDYELFLRYYKNAFQYTEHPYYYYTVGSSMAVKKWAYEKQGGMNKKKAGEDFYFLQKIIQLGDFTELNTTKVIPSPRISDRVPFGTGKAVGEIVQTGNKQYLTYNFQIFKDLKQFFITINEYYDSGRVSLENQPKSIQAFLKDFFEKDIIEINRNSTTLESFRKRFFNYFNAFKVLKFVHFARDNFYENIEISIAVSELFPQLKGMSKKAMLEWIRKENL